MTDNVLKFPGKPNAHPVVVAPREHRAHFPIQARNGNVGSFTVPACDMYWWAAIYEQVAATNPYFENVFYFYSEPYGWQNQSFTKRKTSCELTIDRRTLIEILKAVAYTHILSLDSYLNDDDYELVHDNALMVLGDDLEIDYAMGIFMSPTTNPDRFIINFVECHND
ncbi:hypothetical protein pEaSNUABM10_00246 [Erwinia phage pEa_SNUABM_10]|nr:hypothetical protein pEaSNUABM10_00246 [Erwinia phage pEa_SNUABM_10]